MIGSMIGDVAGSPYNTENSLRPADFVSVDLFQPKANVFFRNRYDGSIVSTLDGMDRREMRQYDAYIKDRKAGPTVFSEDLVRIADWASDGFSAGDVYEGEPVSDHLAVAVACAYLCASAEDAALLSSSVCDASGIDGENAVSAVELSGLLWEASHCGGPAELDLVAEKYGFSIPSGCEEASDMLVGEKETDMAVVKAAFAACAVGSSYEEAVRRGVTAGAPGGKVAAVAGAVAEGMYGGVPDSLRLRIRDFVPDGWLKTVSAARREKQSVVSSDSELSSFRSLSVQGHTPVWVVDERQPHVEAALRRHCRKQGMEFRMIRPQEEADMFARMSEQRDASGKVLSGTYLEHSRPERRSMWLQDGKICTSTTREGKAVNGDRLSSVEKRKKTFSEFQELKGYAEAVRRELEEKAGAECVPGRHVHFASAFYPVVNQRSIDLMQGDVVRGRVGLDDDGRIRVDVNAASALLTGEYLEGVLNSMDIFPRNAGPAEIKSVLNEVCLDFGKIADEDERIELMSDGPEAEAVRMKYGSNIDRAILDVASAGTLAVAEDTDLSVSNVKRHYRTVEKVLESREKYTGVTFDEALYSKSHPGAVFTIGHSNMSMEEMGGLLKKYGIELVVDVRSFPRSEYCPQFNGGEAKGGGESPIEKSLSGIDVSYQWLGSQFGGHIRREDDQKKALYVMETASGVRSYGVFSGNEECLDHCRKVNAGLDPDRRIDQFFAASEETVSKVLASKDCTEELRHDIMDYTGKYLTYDEVMARDSFRSNLRNLRECVKEGTRVAVMCSEQNPSECHRFAMIGRALAHPSDGRVKPVEVQHILRNGQLVSQADLEKKMLSAMGLKDDPSGLDKAFREKCRTNLNRSRDNLPIRLSKKTYRKQGRK